MHLRDCFPTQSPVHRSRETMRETCNKTHGETDMDRCIWRRMGR